MNKATGFICKYILLQLYSFAFGFLKRIHVDIHLQITNAVKLSLNAAEGNSINFHMCVDFRKNIGDLTSLVCVPDSSFFLYTAQVFNISDLRTFYALK